MHPAVYRLFESICQPLQLRGEILEVGAVAGPESLLGMECLGQASRRVGLNKEPQGADILVGDANRMEMFASGRFQAVLSNATLEHDPRFWESLREIHRVTAVGGYIILGVPGYGEMGSRGYFPGLPWWGQRFLRAFLPWSPLQAGTPTLGVHNFPGDYYRFSQQAVEEVFLAGLVQKKVYRVLNPPRFVGMGRKP